MGFIIKQECGHFVDRYNRTWYKNIELSRLSTKATQCTDTGELRCIFILKMFHIVVIFKFD
jgi:hypothetical protein